LDYRKSGQLVKLVASIEVPKKAVGALRLLVGSLGSHIAIGPITFEEIEDAPEHETEVASAPATDAAADATQTQDAENDVDEKEKQLPDTEDSAVLTEQSDEQGFRGEGHEDGLGGGQQSVLDDAGNGGQVTEHAHEDGQLAGPAGQEPAIESVGGNAPGKVLPEGRRPRGRL
jgi:hypothetical protein